ERLRIVRAAPLDRGDLAQQGRAPLRLSMFLRAGQRVPILLEGGLQVPDRPQCVAPELREDGGGGRADRVDIDSLQDLLKVRRRHGIEEGRPRRNEDIADRYFIAAFD